VTIDLTKLVKTVIKAPFQARLTIVALAIVGSITKHQDLQVVLPLVVILAVIVFWLIHGPPQRR
jgi:hypothetical protein